jgi:hypothetical protein
MTNVENEKKKVHEEKKSSVQIHAHGMTLAWDECTPASPHGNLDLLVNRLLLRRLHSQGPNKLDGRLALHQLFSVCPHLVPRCRHPGGKNMM